MVFPGWPRYNATGEPAEESEMALRDNALSDGDWEPETDEFPEELEDGFGEEEDEEEEVSISLSSDDDDIEDDEEEHKVEEEPVAVAAAPPPAPPAKKTAFKKSATKKP